MTMTLCQMRTRSSFYKEGIALMLQNDCGELNFDGFDSAPNLDGVPVYARGRP